MLWVTCFNIDLSFVSCTNFTRCTYSLWLLQNSDVTQEYLLGEALFTEYLAQFQPSPASLSLPLPPIANNDCFLGVPADMVTTSHPFSLSFSLSLFSWKYSFGAVLYIV